jgi:hypothetical protein
MQVYEKYAIDDTDGKTLTYLVLEFCENGELKDKIAKKGQMDEPCLSFTVPCHFSLSK